MCYSKGYKYSDGDVKMFSTGLSMQLAACDTSSAMKGGKRIRKSKSKRKSFRKRKSLRLRKRKNITLY